MRFVLLAGLMLLCIACERKSRTPTRVEPEVSLTATDNTKVAAFKSKVAEYLDEARAGTKWLTLSPSAEESRRRSQKITELYTNLPVVPPEIDSTGYVADRLKHVQQLFDLSVRHASTAQEIKASDPEASKRIYNTELPTLGREVKGLVDEIEAKLGAKK